MLGVLYTYMVTCNVFKFMVALGLDMWIYSSAYMHYSAVIVIVAL